MQDDTTLKACSKCKRLFPSTSVYFTRRKSRRDGLDSWCRECSVRGLGRQFRGFIKPAPDGWKVCASGALQPASIECYPPRRDSKDGLRGTCRACRKRYLEQWENANIDSVREAKRQWRKRNPEKARQCAREYMRRQRSENYREYREKKQRYKIINAEQIRERNKQWRKRNADKKRAEVHRRRAQRKAAEGTHTAEDVKQIYQLQKGKCWYCGKILAGTYHIDHRVPLSRGGTNWPDNLALTCPKCNLSKGGRLPHEWGDRLL